MHRLTTLRIFVVLLLAATVFCSGASGKTVASTSAISTATRCDCQKPEELPEMELPVSGATNIVVRMLEIY